MRDIRRTIIVHTRLAGHMARVEAARAGAHGGQIFTMGRLAARLAGGFLAPIDPDSLQDAVRDALAETDLGELENIKNLPGMVRAAVSTLEKFGRPISTFRRHPSRGCGPWQHWAAEDVLRRLPAQMKKPKSLSSWPAPELEGRKSCSGSNR